MLLGLDDLGFLEDVHGAGKTLERLAHLLGLDDLGLLEDVHGAGEALEGLAHLLGLPGGENRAQFSSDTLLGQGGEHRAQFSSDTLLGRSDGGKELAGALVVTRAVALRADHLVRLRE